MCYDHKFDLTNWCSRRNCNHVCVRCQGHKSHHRCETHMWEDYFRKKKNAKKRKLRVQTRKIDPFDLPEI